MSISSTIFDSLTLHLCSLMLICWKIRGTNDEEPKQEQNIKPAKIAPTSITMTMQDERLKLINPSIFCDTTAAKDRSSPYIHPL